MKTYLKPTAAAVALMLVAGPAAAADYYLAAKAFTKTLPDGSSVPMWGYVSDPDNDLNDVGDCYEAADNTTRLTCINSLADTPLPGPQLTVPADDRLFRIYLSNGLPEPTSIVIPGQAIPFSSGSSPTWDDDSTGPRGADITKRVRSFGVEAAANGGTRFYTWANSRSTELERTGSFIYHSGTHPQKQVYMGLYGAVTKNETDEDIATGSSAEAYPGVPFDDEVTLFYSDIDPVLNKSIAKLYDSTNPDYAAIEPYTTSIHHHPTWFLVNGEPYVGGTTPDIAAGAAGERTLLRLFSAAGETHVPVIQGLRMTIHAEDGFQYSYQNGGTVGGTAPRKQYSAMLPPLKTKDAIIAPTACFDTNNLAIPCRYAVYDGNGYMTNPSDINNFNAGDTVGGMLRFLEVGSANLVAVNDTATTAEGTAVDIDVVLNDSDPVGNGLTVTLLTGPGSGTAVISDPACCVLYTPTANFSGADQFDYTVTDGKGVASTATVFVDVTVTAVNNPPMITSTPVTTATTSQPYSYQVTATDLDLDLGNTPPDVLTFSLTSGPTGMSIDGSSGLISWTPTVQDNAASYDVTVVVTDLASATDTQVYAIGNTLVNVAPTITSTPVTTATAGSAYSYTVTATDPDLGDTQTYSLDQGPVGMSIDDTTGLISWTPTVDQLGDSAVTVIVTDFHGLTDSQAYTIDVTPVNDVPVANDDLIYLNSMETTTIAAALGVLANDEDLYGDPLEAKLLINVSGGALSCPTDLMLELCPDGSFAYLPEGGINNIAVGTLATFTYEANDGIVSSPSATVTLNRTLSVSQAVCERRRNGNCAWAIEGRKSNTGNVQVLAYDSNNNLIGSSRSTTDENWEINVRSSKLNSDRIRVIIDGDENAEILDFPVTVQ